MHMLFPTRIQWDACSLIVRSLPCVFVFLFFESSLKLPFISSTPVYLLPHQYCTAVLVIAVCVCVSVFQVPRGVASRAGGDGSLPENFLAGGVRLVGDGGGGARAATAAQVCGRERRKGALADALGSSMRGREGCGWCQGGAGVVSLSLESPHLSPHQVLVKSRVYWTSALFSLISAHESSKRQMSWTSAWFSVSARSSKRQMSWASAWFSFRARELEAVDAQREGST